MHATRSHEDMSMSDSPDTYATGAAETAITLMLMLSKRANQSHQPVARGTGNGWSQPARAQSPPSISWSRLVIVRMKSAR